MDTLRNLLRCPVPLMPSLIDGLTCLFSFVHSMFAEFGDRYARQEEVHRQMLDTFEAVLEQARCATLLRCSA
jgi:hypothetical protein